MARRSSRIPIDGRSAARFGNPYAVVHRGDLHGVFLRACQANPNIELRTGCDITGYAQDAATATALLRDGEGITGSALVAAEGLWSNIRRQLVGDGPPRVSGHTTYRSVIPTERMPEDLRWNAATLWAGPKCHIVHYPLQGGRTFNLVVTCHNHAPEPVAGKAVPREEVLDAFRHVHPRAQEIIEHGQDWRMWVLCDRDPVANWVDGRVALLGDAAHPMLQYMAQGACMAMEDAVAPGARDGGATRATWNRRWRLTAGRRVHRTARMQLQSRAVGEHIYHPAGVHAELRNEIMRAKSTEDWHDILAWVYDGNGLGDAVRNA